MFLLITHQRLFIDNRKNDFGVGFTTERWVGTWYMIFLDTNRIAPFPTRT